MTKDYEPEPIPNLLLLEILADYSNDLSSLSKRDGLEPATAAVKRIEELFKPIEDKDFTVQAVHASYNHKGQFVPLIADRLEEILYKLRPRLDKETTAERVKAVQEAKAKLTALHQELLDASEQPTPKEQVGGKQVDTPVEKAEELLEIQGVHGTWDYDPYMHGMYNGMEMVLSVIKGVEPRFKDAPDTWVSDLAAPTPLGNLGVANPLKTAIQDLQAKSINGDTDEIFDVTGEPDELRKAIEKQLKLLVYLVAQSPQNSKYKNQARVIAQGEIEALIKSAQDELLTQIEVGMPEKWKTPERRNEQSSRQIGFNEAIAQVQATITKIRGSL